MKKRKTKTTRKVKKVEVIGKNYLDPMPVSEIHDVVSAAKVGAMYTLMMVDGAPIVLDSGDKLYVTETFSVRFKINYYNIKEVIFKTFVEKAWTPEHVAIARRMYNALKHKDYVSAKTINELERKEKLVATGIAIPKPVFKEKEEGEEDEKIDPKKDFFKECKNGNTQLRAYTTFKNSITYSEGKKIISQDRVTIRFFVKQTDGTIFEITPKEDDKKSSTALEKARATARAIAKKKGSGGQKTLCTFPSLRNILKIE